MNDETVRFFVALSHTSLGGIVFLLTVALGVAAFFVERRRRLHRSRGALLGLFAIWPLLLAGVGLCLAGLAHIGCAAQKGRSARCLSQLKQIALATVMYAQDHDETLPPAGRWEALLPYTKNAAPRCPDAKAGSGYAMNAALDTVHVEKIERPADTVLHFETDAPGPSATGGKASVALQRHGQAPHFAFADGHAKSVRSDRTAGLLWSPAAQ